MQDNWKRHMEVICQALKQVQRPDFGGHPFPKMLYQPTFGRTFYWQLYWNHDTVYAHKATYWNDDHLTGDIQLQTGKYVRETHFNRMLHALHKLQIPAIVLNNDHPYGRGGAVIELTIGHDTHQTTIEWWTAHTPDEWNSLDPFAEQLLDYESKLDYQTTQMVKLERFWNIDDNENSLIIDIKKGAVGKINF